MQVLRVSDNFPSFLEHDGLIVTMNDQLDKVEPTPGLENVDPPFFPWFNSIDNVTYYTNVDGYPPPQGQSTELNDVGFVCLKYNPDAVEDFYTVYTIDVTKNDNSDLAGINTSGFVSLGVSAPLSNPETHRVGIITTFNRSSSKYKGLLEFDSITLKRGEFYLITVQFSHTELWDNPGEDASYENEIAAFMDLSYNTSTLGMIDIIIPFPRSYVYRSYTSWSVTSILRSNNRFNYNGPLMLNFSLFFTDVIQRIAKNENDLVGMIQMPNPISFAVYMNYSNLHAS